MFLVFSVCLPVFGAEFKPYVLIYFVLIIKKTCNVFEEHRFEELLYSGCFNGFFSESLLQGQHNSRANHIQIPPESPKIRKMNLNEPRLSQIVLQNTSIW